MVPPYLVDKNQPAQFRLLTARLTGTQKVVSIKYLFCKALSTPHSLYLNYTNLLVFSQVASYLNNAPCTVTGELIEEITGGNKTIEEYSYAMFLSNIFTDDDKLANQLLREYYLKSVRCLDKKEYMENPYYKNIKIPIMQVGKWTLGYQEYQPYEAFIRDDIMKEEYTEIPRIGYFCESFWNGRC